MGAYPPVSEGPRQVSRDTTSDLAKTEAATREWAREVALAIRALQKPASAVAPAVANASVAAAPPVVGIPNSEPIDPSLLAIAALAGLGFLVKTPAGWALNSKVITNDILFQNLTAFQPLSAILTALAALTDAAGVCSNDGAGNLSWTTVSSIGDVIVCQALL